MVEHRQAGYALTEVLIAGAIAAAVITASMTGLSMSLRGAATASNAQQASLEARNIAARLRAGIRPGQIAELYPDWAISLPPYDRPVDPESGAVLTVARLEYAHQPALVLEFVYLEDGARQ
jgi:type II secretory pathway pseudopilin PulG